MVSPLCMLLSSILTTICVGKLVDTGLKFEIFSYSLVVEKVLGPFGRLILDIMIVITQFSFTLSQAVFIIESMQSSVNEMFNINTHRWPYGVALLICWTGFSWVRDIAKFSFSYLIGNLLLLLTVIVVSVDASTKINSDGIAQGLEPINSEGYLSTIGFCIYAFEGIGVVMPIMQSCAVPD